jgi:hypothetical protein
MEDQIPGDRKRLEDILPDPDYISKFTQEEKQDKIKVTLEMWISSQFLRYHELQKYLGGNSVPIDSFEQRESFFSDTYKYEYKGGSKEKGFYSLVLKQLRDPVRETIKLTTSKNGCDTEIICGVVDALRQYIQLYQLYTQEQKAKKKQPAAA